MVGITGIWKVVGVFVGARGTNRVTTGGSNGPAVNISDGGGPGGAAVVEVGDGGIVADGGTVVAVGAGTVAVGTLAAVVGVLATTAGVWVGLGFTGVGEASDETMAVLAVDEAAVGVLATVTVTPEGVVVSWVEPAAPGCSLLLLESLEAPLPIRNATATARQRITTAPMPTTPIPIPIHFLSMAHAFDFR